MAQLKLAQPVLFFVSVLYRKNLFDRQSLLKHLSTHDLFRRDQHRLIFFDHPFFPMGSYYQKEMCPDLIDHDLHRLLILAPIPAEREKLVDLKLWACHLENQWLDDRGGRSLNLDPGYLSLENMVLSTTKSFAHRIYLGQGVYADLNLTFVEKTYHPLHWTYPDYAHPDFIQFFNWARGFLQFM